MIGPRGVLLDWFGAVLPDSPSTWAGLRARLGPMIELEHGRNGYDRAFSVLETGIVCHCTDPARAVIQGVWVDLSGKACAALGAKLQAFFAWCLRVGRVTRADWAIDDRAGLVTYDRIMECNRVRGIVKRWKGDLHQNSTHAPGGELTGWTLSLGKRGNESYLRVYDKAAQQKVSGPWVRVELETRGKFADALCREYLKRGSEAVLEQLARRVRFTIPVPSDSNPWRWPEAPWWAEFMGGVKPGRKLIAAEKREPEIVRMGAWVERQTAPTLAALVLAEGGDVARIYSMIEKGLTRLKPKHLAALAGVGVLGPGVAVSTRGAYGLAA